MNFTLQEFESAFKNHSNYKTKKCSTKDYKSSKYKILSYRNSEIQSFKSEEYDLLDNREKLEFLNHIILYSSISECVSWAFYKTQDLPTQELISNKRLIFNWSYTIENWWHCDHLSSIYNSILSKDRLFYKELQAMNKFSSLWQRRLSITSLYYYAKVCVNPIDIKLALPLVEHLLLDEEYYVQKGIGWTLREMSLIDYQITLDFMKLHAKHIPSTGFSTSIEKLANKDKEELKHIRKQNSSNPHEFKGHSDNTINHHPLKTFDRR